jgi:hypothetical protein
MGNKYFSKEDPDSGKSEPRRSASLILREMQIKTTVGQHLTPTRMAAVGKMKRAGNSEGVVKGGYAGNVN